MSWQKEIIEMVRDRARGLVQMHGVENDESITVNCPEILDKIETLLEEEREKIAKEFTKGTRG